MTHGLDELCANCAQLGGNFPVAVLGRADELGAQGLNHALLHLHMRNPHRPLCNSLKPLTPVCAQDLISACQ